MAAKARQKLGQKGLGQKGSGQKGPGRVQAGSSGADSAAGQHAALMQLKQRSARLTKLQHSSKEGIERRRLETRSKDDDAEPVVSAGYSSIGVDAAGRITSRTRLSYCERFDAQLDTAPVPAPCPSFERSLDADRAREKRERFRCRNGRMHECALALGLSQHHPTCCEELRVRFLNAEETPSLLRLSEATGNHGCEVALETYACAERLSVRNKTRYGRHARSGAPGPASEAAARCAR